jgi:hypothetical protein
MALSHYITDGTTTLQLNDGTAAWTESWGMSNPGAGEAWAVDVHEIELLGGNVTVLANQVTLHRLLQQARMWQDPKTRRFGQRVFYHVSLDGSTTYRCELAGGEFVPTPERVKGEWAIGRRRGTLTLMRRNWIEGPESQISLTNLNGTDNTAGLRVYPGRCDLTGIMGSYKVNWFDILKAKISGDLPAGIKIKFDYINNVEQPLVFSAFKSVGAIPNTTTYDGLHWEDTLTGGTLVSAAGYSGGNYYYNNTNPVEMTTAKDVGLFGSIAQSGNFFYRIFAAMSWSTGGTYKFTPHLRMKYSSWYGQPVLVTAGMGPWIYDLGLIKAPRFVSTVENNVWFSIEMSNPANVTLNVDFVAAVPCNQTRVIRFDGSSATTKDITDDQLDEERAYLVDTATNQVGSEFESAGEITLTPGYNHRIYVTTVQNYDYYTMYSLFKLYYRPRYLAI